jgi:hypothetical protein
MTEAQRLAGAQVTIAELLVVRDIGAADARRFYGDLQLANAGVFNRSPFL